MSVPKGESPVSAGVVPGSQASGKVVIGDDGTEVSQTAVSKRGATERIKAQVSQKLGRTER